ncbi:hypothetical protein ACWDRX_34930, partial [Streptomyces nigra]
LLAQAGLVEARVVRKPLECRNVALTHDNAAALNAQAERLDARLHAHPVLPPLIHTDLERRRDAIRTFLTTANGAIG